MSFGSNVEVKQPQSQRDPSVLTSICSALSQFIFSVLFNLCVIWNSQAWRTGDETKCLLSCKYCKWNHGVAPPSSRDVSNYGRVIRLLCQVKSCTSSCVIAAAAEVREWRKCCAREMRRSRGRDCPVIRPLEHAREAIPVEKICSPQSKQVVKSLLEVSLWCPHLSHRSL